MTGIVSTLAPLGKTDSQLITLDKSDTQDFCLKISYISPQKSRKSLFLSGANFVFKCCDQNQGEEGHYMALDLLLEWPTHTKHPVCVQKQKRTFTEN